LWNVYTVSANLEKTKTEYYTLKAKYNAVKQIIETGKDQIVKDELEVNVVNLVETDKETIKQAINKYTNYKPSFNSSSFQSFTFSFDEPQVEVTSEQNTETTTS
jgi:hypothetical protein